MEYDTLKERLLEISSIVSKFPESVQDKVFDLLVSSFNKLNSKSEPTTSSIIPPKKKAVKKGTSGKPKILSSKKKDSFTLLKDLDLTGKTIKKEAFSTFVKHKKFTSHVQFVTISIYYLEKIMNLQNITIDHVYTCYKNINKRPPNNLVQCFKDASGKRFGYIDFSDRANIKIPHIGVTLVENDWEEPTND